MLGNYLKIAFRNLLRYKTHSFVNIVGLAIGLAGCFLILGYVLYEMSFDRYHEKAGRIFRIVYGDGPYIHSTPLPLAPALRTGFPEVLAVRVMKASLAIRKGDEWITEGNSICADKEFFEVFTLPLIHGDPKAVLEDPYSVVITEEIANKYFNDSSPVGRVLTIRIEKQPLELKVAGVIEHFPTNSHHRADLIASMDVAYKTFEPFEKAMAGRFGFQFSMRDNWGASTVFTYLLLPEGDQAAKFEKRLPEFNRTYFGDVDRFHFHLQPLTDIYLQRSYAGSKNEAEEKGSMRSIYVFSTIALLILAAACINFVALSTARSTTRIKEVALRKVIGASRFDLMQQVLGESILIALMAMPVAFVLVELCLPQLNRLSGEAIPVDYFVNWRYLVMFFAITVFVGLLSGSYVAFGILGFQPVDMFRNNLNRSGRPSPLKRGLVIAGSAIFALMTVCSMVIYRQLHFLHHKEMGFNKNHLLSFTIPNEAFRNKYPAFKQALKANSGIINVSAAFDVPPSESGMAIKVAMPEHPDNAIEMKLMMVDYNYLETLEVRILHGRTFSERYGQDPEESVILNESAMRELGLEQPLGQIVKIDNFPKAQQVIGVIHDFHESSLHSRIQPMVFKCVPSQIGQVVMRIHPQNASATLKSIKETWASFNQDETFSYSFIDDECNRFYRSEERLGEIIGYFTLLTVIVVCLGLFGLSQFMAENRIKEIGIRKVLGATVTGIVSMLSKDFVASVLIANLLALPIAYYAMNRWLQNFAYRIEINWWLFVAAGGMALVIALLTVSTQAVKAALANPVEALRYE